MEQPIRGKNLPKAARKSVHITLGMLHVSLGLRKHRSVESLVIRQQSKRTVKGVWNAGVRAVCTRPKYEKKTIIGEASGSGHILSTPTTVTHSKKIGCALTSHPVLPTQIRSNQQSLPIVRLQPPSPTEILPPTKVLQQPDQAYLQVHSHKEYVVNQTSPITKPSPTSTLVNVELTIRDRRALNEKIQHLIKANAALSDSLHKATQSSITDFETHQAYRTYTDGELCHLRTGNIRLQDDIECLRNELVRQSISTSTSPESTASDELEARLQVIQRNTRAALVDNERKNKKIEQLQTDIEKLQYEFSNAKDELEAQIDGLQIQRQFEVNAYELEKGMMRTTIDDLRVQLIKQALPIQAQPRPISCVAAELEDGDNEGGLAVELSGETQIFELQGREETTDPVELEATSTFISTNSSTLPRIQISSAFLPNTFTSPINPENVSVNCSRVQANSSLSGGAHAATTFEMMRLPDQPGTRAYIQEYDQSLSFWVSRSAYRIVN